MKTLFWTFIKLIAFFVCALSVSVAYAQQIAASSGDMRWVNAPASLPPGAKLVMLRGDLHKSGPFALRLKFPPGYKLGPNSSAAIERIFVLSGTLNVGNGKRFDRARAMPMSEGYEYTPGNSPFFGWTTEETTVEIEGVGPWQVTYVNPSDDPRRKN